MTFNDIKNKLKPTYKTSHDDLVNDFYNLVLSESVCYDRVTGFFNSTSLAIAASGLSQFILNEGHMRLLCGYELDDSDLNSIENSEQLKNIIDNKFIEDINSLEDEFTKNHVEMLGWMIANNYLEIKIGIVQDKEISSMLHSKIGIMYDEDDNIISFDGSVNETAHGWKHNIESLKVFVSWEDKKFMEDDITYFNMDWNNQNNALKVIDIPTASKEKLIRIAPKNIEDLKIVKDTIQSNTHKRKLFKHQQEALDAWFDNDKQGIIEMATGTGKTFTALKCLEKVLKEDNNVLTIIACPFAHLITQWAFDIQNMDLGNIHLFYGDNPRWRKEMNSLIFNMNLGIEYPKPNIILTTHNTFSNENFINIMNEYIGKACLIVDEMHHVGAPSFRKGLLPVYNYKLGLSATPTRYMDEIGTDYIISYFGDTVYEFNIIQALTQINPATGLSFLTPYEYHPVKVGLTDEEFKEYKRLSKKIARLSHINTDSNEKEENLSHLKIIRKNVLNNAYAKYDTLRNVLKKINNKDHLIVFCSSEQIDKVKKILDEENFDPKHKFTQEEGTKPEDKYGGLSERQYILKLFDEGKYKSIVSIKCLNEGVDVPSANKVIIMSSTTNPIENIQRRGRVLRRYPGKDKAIIYDLTVIPDQEGNTVDNIINNDYERITDFIDLAINKNKCYELLEKWGVY